MGSPPEWLFVGAKVVEFTPVQHGGDTAHIVETTIKSIGKRDVVLDNGERYNVDRLRKQRGTWDPSTNLLSADDPQIAVARRANVRSSRLNKTHTAWEAFRRTPNEEQAAALISTVKRYVASLEPGPERSEGE
ncbi:MAG TPA: hypothetical protein VNV87_01665 [Acidimicrobiales bacterium]|jgi:hypothetical protein|nr:hypothetical protein [Acidimicrobiales bacterium]